MATEPLLTATPPDQSSAAPHKSAGPHKFSEIKSIILDRSKRQDLAMEDLKQEVHTLKWALNSANSEVAHLNEELAKVQSELLESHWDTDSEFIQFASSVESRLAEVEKTYKGKQKMDYDSGKMSTHTPPTPGPSLQILKDSPQMHLCSSILTCQSHSQ
ncbi:hypothetical protein BDR26DRAFT_916698 [Obelidium mucronatum]|nr:hypothetical protein BDR26DRAFT_916698 [Obelidium mucronatum]